MQVGRIKWIENLTEIPDNSRIDRYVLRQEQSKIILEVYHRNIPATILSFPYSAKIEYMIMKCRKLIRKKTLYIEIWLLNRDIKNFST